MSDTDILWAFAAAEAASVAAAMEVLQRQGQADQHEVEQAWRDADEYSARWAQLAPERAQFRDNDERMFVVRCYLTQHVGELEELRERLVL